MLDLNLLLAFEALLIEQNVTVAATRMALTQSAMSNALGRLRQAFDDPLFVKTRSGMLPTARALELARPVKDALALIRGATQKSPHFDPLRSDRRFRLHMSDVGEMVFLPKLIRHLRQIGSTVGVETAQLTSEHINRQLASGEIDFAIGYLPGLDRTLEKIALFRENYVCLERAGDPKGRAKLTTQRFFAASHVAIDSMGSGHDVIERTLNRHRQRNIALRVPHFVVIPTIIADTDLVVTVPSRVASTIADQVKVSIHPLPVSIPSFDVALYWHRRFASDVGIRWLRDLLQTLFQEPRVTRKS